MIYSYRTISSICWVIIIRPINLWKDVSYHKDRQHEINGQNTFDTVSKCSKSPCACARAGAQQMSSGTVFLLLHGSFFSRPEVFSLVSVPTVLGLQAQEATPGLLLVLGHKLKSTSLCCKPPLSHLSRP